MAQKLGEPINLKNVEISVFQGTGNTKYNNGKPSRRLFVGIEDLSKLPAELFAIKISQSQKPELAGKPAFKYLSYRVKDDEPYKITAAPDFTPATDVTEVKEKTVDSLMALKKSNPKVKFSLNINLNGDFANISTKDGNYTIFDDKQFPDTEGQPGYYIKTGTTADVALTKADSAYGPYYRVDLSTDKGPDDIFQRRAQSKVWGAEDTSSQADEKPENDSEVW